MIVLVVHQFGIPSHELKREPPVATHPHRPDTFALALECVEAKTGQVDITGGRGYVEPTEYEPQSFGMLSLNARLGAMPIPTAGSLIVPSRSKTKSAAGRRCGHRSSWALRNFIARRPLERRVGRHGIKAMGQSRDWSARMRQPQENFPHSIVKKVSNSGEV